MLGAAMFMVEIGGMRVLYTGDYSRLPDRHLSAADLPDVKPDIGTPPQILVPRPGVRGLQLSPELSAADSFC